MRGMVHSKAMKRRSLFLALILAAATWAQETNWVVTWSASPAPQMATTAEMTSAKMLFNNQTLRMVVHTSIAGDTVRVRLSNVYGKAALQVDSTHTALRASAANTVAGTDHALTFSGRSAIVIPPDAVMLSDPLSMHVPAAADLAISIYLSKPMSGAGIHYSANATSYIGSGDQTAAVTFTRTTTVASWAFVAGVDVLAPDAGAAIVAFGDSITDGSASTVDANHRWPNYLFERLLHARVTDIAVVDSGIGGNRILHDPATEANTKFGVNGLARFERDVLAQPGARYVIILEGINDLGHPGTTTAPISEAVTADDLIAGLSQMYARAHEMGFEVIGATLTPFAGYASAGYYTPDKDAQRAAINQWIRTTGALDGYVDFDLAVRDPSRPDYLLPAYDSGDHLHPGDAGYQAMADAIDLTLFRHLRTGRRRP